MSELIERALNLEIDKLRIQIAKLKNVPMKYRRMEFNAQLQKENENLRYEIEMLEQDADARLESANKQLATAQAEISELKAKLLAKYVRNDMEEQCKKQEFRERFSDPQLREIAELKAWKNRTERTMNCGTVDSFLTLSDEDKRKWFVGAIREGSERKRLEEKLASHEATIKVLREALEYHQEQTRPISKTQEALAIPAPNEQRSK